MDDPDFDRKPDAETMTVASNHDKWALHEFAFEQDADWLPVKLRAYHKDRFVNGELMEGYFDEFIPEPYDSDRGQVLRKAVEINTTHCPECEVPAKSVDGEAICPECGLVCNSSGPDHEIIRDGKAAHRTDGYDS